MEDHPHSSSDDSYGEAHNISVSNTRSRSESLTRDTLLLPADHGASRTRARSIALISSNRSLPDSAPDGGDQLSDDDSDDRHVSKLDYRSISVKAKQSKEKMQHRSRRSHRRRQNRDSSSDEDEGDSRKDTHDSKQQRAVERRSRAEERHKRRDQRRNRRGGNVVKKYSQFMRRTDKHIGKSHKDESLEVEDLDAEDLGARHSVSFSFLYMLGHFLCIVFA